MTHHVFEMAMKWYKRHNLPVRSTNGHFFYITKEGFLLSLSGNEILKRANDQKEYEHAQTSNGTTISGSVV